MFKSQISWNLVYSIRQMRYTTLAGYVTRSIYMRAITEISSFSLT